MHITSFSLGEVVTKSQKESRPNSAGPYETENIEADSESVEKELFTSVASFNGLENDPEDETRAAEVDDKENREDDLNEDKNETFSEAKIEVEKESNEILTKITSGAMLVTGAAAVTSFIATESGNDSEERNGDVEETSEETKKNSERAEDQEHVPDNDSQDRNREVDETFEEERNGNEMEEENSDKNQEEQESRHLGEANDGIIETTAAEERESMGEDEIGQEHEDEIEQENEDEIEQENEDEIEQENEDEIVQENEDEIEQENEDEIEQEIRDDDAAVGTLESPIEVRRLEGEVTSEKQEVEEKEEEHTESETVFEEESEKVALDVEENTANKEVFEENITSKMVDEARLGTGGRIALAMANAHNILDSEDEKANIAVEDHKVAASEELPAIEIAKLKGNYFESEVEDRNGNISVATLEQSNSKSNMKDGIPLVDRRE